MLLGHHGTVRALSHVAMRRLLASGVRDSTVCLYALDELEEPPPPPGEE
jgi:hypothetical protein